MGAMTRLAPALGRHDTGRFRTQDVIKKLSAEQALEVVKRFSGKGARAPCRTDRQRVPFGIG